MADHTAMAACIAVTDWTAMADSVAAEASQLPSADSAAASKVPQGLVQITGLAKVTHSTQHSVCSHEQCHKPETAGSLPCWTGHG